MRKVIRITKLLLLTSSFLSMRAFALVDTKDTTNIITANIAQEHALPSSRKDIGAENETEIARIVAERDLKKEISKISWAAHSSMSKVVITGNKSITTEKLQDVIAPYLGGKIPKKEARNIASAIETLYIDKGYFLPVTHLSFEGTTLKVKIVEGKIRKVLVIFGDENRDKKVLDNKLFLDLLKKIEEANTIKTRDLERYLMLINEIYGYFAEYELKPIDNPIDNAVADLAIKISTTKGVASISVDNTGTSDLGINQINLSGHAFNPISNDSLMLNAGTTNRPERMRLITAGYTKRLNSYGTSAKLFGSYMQNNPNKSIAGSKYNISEVLKGDLEQYLILNNDYILKLEAGISGRNITNYVANGIKANAYKYALGSIGGKVKIKDPLGIDNFFYPYYHWTLNQVRYATNTLTNFDKRFNFFTIDWSRNQPLPHNFSFLLKAFYQVTNKNLPLEHAYSINTGRTARGYRTASVSGDQGITGVAELRYSYEYASEEAQKFIKNIQPFIFYDITKFIKHNTATKTTHAGVMTFNKSNLPSAGLGTRLFLTNEFYGEGAVEFPLLRHININGVRQTNKTIYRFVISKEFNW